MIPYTLLRTKRKTMAIQIRKDGTVLLRIPMEGSEQEARAFLERKEEWVKEHLIRVIKEKTIRNDFSLNYGDKVLFLGKEYALKEGVGTNAFILEDEIILPKGSCPLFAMVEFYIEKGKEVLDACFRELSGFFPLQPQKVRITKAHSRWGSCSAKNSLNFSYLLFMADYSTVRYVVTHELCHTEEHNHSKRFWSLVAELCPDFQREQEKLRRLEERLNLEQWP